MDIAGCPWPVLLCTCFCERQQTTAHQSFDVLPQYVRGYNAVMIMLLTFVNLQWVTVEHHSIWFRAQKSLVQLPKQVEFPLGLSMLTCWMGELLQAHFLLTTLWFQNEKVKLLIDVTSPGKKNHRMRSFGVIWIKISYGTSKELMNPLWPWILRFLSMYHDPSDLWSMRAGRNWTYFPALIVQEIIKEFFSACHQHVPVQDNLTACFSLGKVGRKQNIFYCHCKTILI